MPCNHKFRKHLLLQGLDFEPETLIVGSFDPEWPASNTAQWFYGRTATTYLWDVLPRIYGEPSLIDAPAADWQQFCRFNKIAFTDLISGIDDADPSKKNHDRMMGGFSDNALVYNFDDFVFTNIVGVLKQHPSIKNVYLTRGVTEAFWRHLWNPVAHYCSVNGLRERKMLTPDDSVAYHHKAWNQEHPDAQIARLQDYILMRWRQDWHF
jgi:hypothetical protein